MTTLTIKQITDQYNSRDAQAILRNVVIQLTHEDDWAEIIATAKTSQLVNTDHPDSRKMRSVSRSQILDRMNVKALSLLVTWLSDEGDHLPWSQHVISGLGGVVMNGRMAVSEWPFRAYQTDDVNWGEVANHAFEVADPENGTEAAVAEGDSDTPSYSVSDDIATAANVLLRVATGGAMDDLQSLLNEVVSLRNKAAQPAVVAVPAAVQSSGDIPAGTGFYVNAQRVFGVTHELLDFDITTYEWDGNNPLVPAKNDDYCFDASILADALWALESKSNAWLTGHTGTGKSTFVSQICAYTGRMLARVNMDSGIERPDFVGSVEVTTDDDGVQVTRFKDGVLPKAMQMPCVLLLDEYDAVRPDISYVMQPVLEGEPLRLLEDGGRMVYPHPDFRIMATANTVGSGDSSGMYASAVKVQSRASINRFNTFIKVGYLPVCDEMKIVKKYAPNMSPEAGKMIENFVTYYRQGFLDGVIATPISPRNTITIGKYVNAFERRIGAVDAVKRALEMNVMLTIDEADAIAVKGIMDRTTAGE